VVVDLVKVILMVLRSQLDPSSYQGDVQFSILLFVIIAAGVQAIVKVFASAYYLMK
jgi:hypothetical protein